MAKPFSHLKQSGYICILKRPKRNMWPEFCSATMKLIRISLHRVDRIIIIFSLVLTFLPTKIWLNIISNIQRDMINHSWHCGTDYPIKVRHLFRLPTHALHRGSLNWMIAGVRVFKHFVWANTTVLNSTQTLTSLTNPTKSVTTKLSSLVKH